MKKLFLSFLFSVMVLSASAQQYMLHPWQGTRIGYIGDSITDPNCIPEVKKYWAFLSEWLDITTSVYAISGYDWNNANQLVDRMIADRGQDLDAVMVFLGTNDFNEGLPIGEWFIESRKQTLRAVGQPIQMVTRTHREPVMNSATFKGRINILLSRLKSTYPDKQIILLTPLHRALANFGDTNYQPDENYQNECGEYISAYVDAIKEAANVWAVTVIDMNSLSGLNPMVESNVQFFNNYDTDRLHPNTRGHERIAKVLMQQLIGIASPITPRRGN